jgi:hypothetical protein
MIFSLLLLISCAHTPTISPEAVGDAEDALTLALREATRVTACMAYLEEILDIQDEREANNVVMSKFTERYNTGRISLDDHKAAFGEWHTKESSLYSDVTALYNTAYALRCFE